MRFSRKYAFGAKLAGLEEGIFTRSGSDFVNCGKKCLFVLRQRFCQPAGLDLRHQAGPPKRESYTNKKLFS